MRTELAYPLSLIDEGKLGIIEFTRYSLSVNEQKKEKKERILIETLAFILHSHKAQLSSLKASSDSLGNVLLVTLQFDNQSLANLLLNFTHRQETPSFLKKFELAGSKAMYQYDSIQKNSFYSNFILDDPYQVELNLSAEEQDGITDILKKIYWSINEKKEVHFKGALL